MLVNKIHFLPNTILIRNKTLVTFSFSKFQKFSIHKNKQTWFDLKIGCIESFCKCGNRLKQQLFKEYFFPELENHWSASSPSIQQIWYSNYDFVYFYWRIPQLQT